MRVFLLNFQGIRKFSTTYLYSIYIKTVSSKYVSFIIFLSDSHPHGDMRITWVFLSWYLVSHHTTVCNAIEGHIWAPIFCYFKIFTFSSIVCDKSSLVWCSSYFLYYLTAPYWNSHYPGEPFIIDITEINSSENFPILDWTQLSLKEKVMNIKLVPRTKF